VSVVGDRDVFEVSVANPDTVVQFVTLDPSGKDCATGAPYSMTSMQLTLLGSTGSEITSDGSNSGVGPCSALSYTLQPGTYYIQVDKSSGTLAGYLLQVRFPTSGGTETEVNDTLEAANPLTGIRSYVLGDHQVSTDADWYRITIPPGGPSLRAEIIEGDALETCDSNGIDSTLTLYDSAGTRLGDNGDTDRNYCSVIDGTGNSPVDSFAHALAAGTYYLQVRSYQTASTPDNQFNYRMLVTIRYP